MVNKIFQIGFNKCGTSSLYCLFKDYCVPNVKSVHWDYANLALTIRNNLLNKKPLLKNYETNVFFSDMESIFYNENNEVEFIEAYKYYTLLDDQYPNSKFILNTRPIDKWITSRLNHKGYFSKIINFQISNTLNNYEYINYYKNFYKTENLILIINRWKKDYKDHINLVRKYFSNRSNDFLEYNIERDNFSKIKEFFNINNIKFNIDKMPHVNETFSYKYNE